jgi:hypothetical protein
MQFNVHGRKPVVCIQGYSSYFVISKKREFFFKNFSEICRISGQLCWWCSWPKFIFLKTTLVLKLKFSWNSYNWGEGKKKGPNNFALTYRAYPEVHSMWSCTENLDEEKPKCACLAQEIGFGTATFALAGEVHCNDRHHGRTEECNKYDLTACYSVLSVGL